MRILYIFIDGIGFGSRRTDENPFSRFASSYLASLGGHDAELPDWQIQELDAHQGFPGLPQSATGQTSLWTGINGSKVMGHHKTGFPGPSLVKVIEKHSIVKVFREHGYKAGLANAYSERYIDRLKKYPRFKSASTHVQLAAGLPLHTLEDLKKGEALYMDITHEAMHSLHPELKARFPIQSPALAAQKLLGILRKHDLLLYEYFLSDKAGHKMDWEMSRWIIRTLEDFLDALVKNMDPTTELLVLSSDHGNLEDLTSKTHTHNPVPLFAYGKGAGELCQNAKTLVDVPRQIYEQSGIQAPLSVQEP